MRAVIAAVGVEGGLWLEKGLVALVCFVIARYGERKIRRGGDWVWEVLSTRCAKAWMRGGDRSWIAYLPLYGAAISQLVAATSWMCLLH